jgi:hypothetical protein
LFAVFDDPACGLSAAVAMQRAVGSADWPDGAAVRVRIGLDVGAPLVADGAYVGLTVNRAARICSAGHGGQVLVSRSARDAVGDAREFRLLGSYALAGLPDPEPIFQIEIAGTRNQFPPLRAEPVKTRRRFRLGRPRHVPTEPTLADAAWLARKQLPAVSRDLRVPLGELGGALFTAERAADRADGLLHRVDRRRLETRLEEQRVMAVLSDRAEAEAAALAAQIATVDDAMGRRKALTELARETTDLLNDPGAATAAALAALRRRTTDATEALDDAVTRTAAALDPLAFRLTRTRHRGVYHSGATYVVPFVDSLGADRCRDFESLSEAQAFSAALKIVTDAKPGHVPILPPDATGG